MAGRFTRRGAMSVIGAAGGAVGSGIAGNALWAKPNKAGQPFLLLDPRIENKKIKGIEPLIEGKQKIILDREVVRQWRSELSALFHKSGSLDAIVLWDNMTLLSGLARESGARVKQTRLGANIHYLELRRTV